MKYLKVSTVAVVPVGPFVAITDGVVPTTAGIPKAEVAGYTAGQPPTEEHAQ